MAIFPDFAAGLAKGLAKVIAELRASRQLMTLWVGLGLSSVCTAFFAVDVFGDLVLGKDFPGGKLHVILELVVVVVSLTALVFHIRELRAFSRKHQKMSDQVRVASGQFADVVEELFSSWVLTASERDVAIFLVKGVSFKEIAEARGAKEGTVKAQANAVYRKADVSGRHQLVALFLDELLQDVSEAQQAAPPEKITPEQSSV
jgi:DNA-binding CsgD family transcriptional regulator